MNTVIRPRTVKLISRAQCCGQCGSTPPVPIMWLQERAAAPRALVWSGSMRYWSS